MGEERPLKDKLKKKNPYWATIRYCCEKLVYKEITPVLKNDV